MNSGPNSSVSEMMKDMEFVGSKAVHLKLVASGRRRSISCLGPEMEDERTLVVGKKNIFSWKWKSCYDYTISTKVKSRKSIVILRVKLCSNLVMWVRDGQNRYLGSVRVESGTNNLSILDSNGLPCANIETDKSTDPSTSISDGSSCSRDRDTQSGSVTSYRCSRTNLIFATARLFRTDLKPRFKSVRVITLDFRPNCSTLTISDADWKRRLLCLASLLLVESVTGKQ